MVFNIILHFFFFMDAGVIKSNIGPLRLLCVAERQHDMAHQLFIGAFTDTVHGGSTATIKNNGIVGGNAWTAMAGLFADALQSLTHCLLIQCFQGQHKGIRRITAEKFSRLHMAFQNIADIFQQLVGTIRTKQLVNVFELADIDGGRSIFHILLAASVQKLKKFVPVIGSSQPVMVRTLTEPDIIAVVHQKRRHHKQQRSTCKQHSNHVSIVYHA